MSLRIKKISLSETDTPRAVIAIGDVHGDSNRLKSVLNWVRHNTENPLLVFLGDYVDRGPDSKAVIDLVREALHEFPDSIAIAGNHDDYFSNWVNGADDETVLQWLDSGFMGGSACIASFGLEADQACALPECYVRFVNEELTDVASLSCPAGNFVFAHGGYDWDLPIGEQDIRTLHFGGKEFWTKSDKDFRVIFGHWIWDRPKVWHDRIGLDTGCPFGELSFAVFDTHDTTGKISYYSTRDNAGKRPYGTGSGISRTSPRQAEPGELERLQATTF